MTIIWSYNAMAAVPTPATLDQALIDALAGRVNFRKGKTGTANLICPVPATLHHQFVRSLFLTYRDGDGNRGPSVVSAALRFIRKSDGHVETVGNGNVSSNDNDPDAPAPNSGPNGWATHQSAKKGKTIANAHTLNFDQNYYYVQITLERSDDAVPLAVIGVYLID